MSDDTKPPAFAGVSGDDGQRPGPSWMMVTQAGELIIQTAIVDAGDFTPGFLDELRAFMQRHNVLSLSCSWAGRHR